MKARLLAAVAMATIAYMPAAATPAGSPRTIIPLANGWRFQQDDAVVGAQEPGFADGSWARVGVPHSWNRAGYYLPNPADHLNRPDNINKTMGIGWYRLNFTPPAAMAGKRVWLQFDAASRTAKVWLNGVYLGQHDGGFSRFRLDATAALKPGRPNLLAVQTDNRKPAPGSPTADILPLSGDFFVHGGLYRPVSLVATNPLHIDMLDAGGPGIYASTERLDAAGARIVVRAKLRNDGAAATSIALVSRLIDADGHTAAIARRNIVMRAGSSTEQVGALEVASPHLWQGVDDPHLYKLAVELRDGKGVLLDRVEQPFGIRQMRFDPQQGFFLNGRPYQIRGVGYHQDREGKGWAISPEDVAEDFAILREMGANSVRLTHYQHGQAEHDLADRYGFILWDEIPLVTAWTLGSAKEPTAGLVANARQQLREMIRQNYNHPSVATWGIANEVDFGSKLPAFLGGATDGTILDPLPLLRDLRAVAHGEDPSRPTVLANCCEAKVLGNEDLPVTGAVTDLNGANRYFGWYLGSPGELGPHLDTLHGARPQQPLAVSEYGAGGATTMHTDDVLGGPVDSRGRAQPEEYQSYVHEQSWPALQSKAYLWGRWLWCAFDFATTVRREGDSDDINTKGLVTYDRKIRKDAYFFYKANWSRSPTVYITGRRYVDRAYPIATVRVYSNAPATELTLGGRSLGVRQACPDSICEWKDVRLASGTNQIVATARFATGAVADTVTWRRPADPGAPLRIDAGALVAAGTTKPFGSDTFFEGGTAKTMNKPADFNKPSEPAAITGTDEIGVAATYREGSFTYHVPVDDGRYTVTLTFVEPSAKPGERKFDVVANGSRALTAVDVAAAAGAPLRAVTRQFPVDVNGGRLDLAFVPAVGQPIVSAIEIAR